VIAVRKSFLSVLVGALRTAVAKVLSP